MFPSHPPHPVGPLGGSIRGCNMCPLAFRVTNATGLFSLFVKYQVAAKSSSDRRITSRKCPLTRSFGSLPGSHKYSERWNLSEGVVSPVFTTRDNVFVVNTSVGLEPFDKGNVALLMLEFDFFADSTSKDCALLLRQAQIIPTTNNSVVMRAMPRVIAFSVKRKSESIRTDYNGLNAKTKHSSRRWGECRTAHS